MLPFEVTDVDSLAAFLISPDDTVRLAPLRAPTPEADYSVYLEIWEPGGSQPPNTHAEEVETFLFLRGHGVATVDGIESTVAAGQYLVLASRTVHRVANTGTGRMYAITTMVPDGGFHELVTKGTPTSVDEGDRGVLREIFSAR